MIEGWRQSWADLFDSLRGDPSRVRHRVVPDVSPPPDEASKEDLRLSGGKQHPDSTGPTTVAGSDDCGEAAEEKGRPEAPAPSPTITQGTPEHRSQKKFKGGSFAILTAIATIAAAPWVLSSFHWVVDLGAPKPPAPDVVATFETGQITLADVESHLNLLAPSRVGELTRAPQMLYAIVEDLVADQLVLRWAAARKPEGQEAFRHAVKHINEELNLDSFASQLHEESLPVAESEMRTYYDANRARFDGRTFAEARDEIRQVLVAAREPEFIENYLRRLRTNASIVRNFELLEVPTPTDNELQLYYRSNLDKFALARRAIVDEIEIPLVVSRDSAQQRASDVLLRIRGGASFKDAADGFPGARLTLDREVVAGTRLPEWDSSVFALTVGELGSVFRAGDSFFIIRLRDIKPARTQSLSEVRSIVATSVQRQKERDWFDANGAKTLFTLKGQGYSLKQLYEEYAELPASLQSQYAGSEGMRKLADALIDRMLLVEDTYDKLLDVKTRPLADEKRLRLLRQMLEQEEVDDRIQVTEAEKQTFYAQNRQRIAYPSKARIRYIRIGLGASDDDARRAEQRADEAYGKLAPGIFGRAADFASVAREYSEDTESAAKGGELANWIGEDLDPLSETMGHSFYEAVLRRKTGEISKPFESAGSLYIIQVIERTEPQPLSFEEAKPYIDEVLTERKHESLAADLQNRLLKEANVFIYQDILETYLRKRSQLDTKG